MNTEQTSKSIFTFPKSSWRQKNFTYEAKSIYLGKVYAYLKLPLQKIVLKRYLC